MGRWNRMKFESFVEKAARAARSAVLANRWMMGNPDSLRYGEELSRVVAKAVRDAFKEKSG